MDSPLVKKLSTYFTKVNIIILVFAFGLGVFLFSPKILAQDCTNLAPDQKLSCLQQQIKEAEEQLLQTRQKKITLQNEITYSDKQIILTSLKIQEIEEQISVLTNQIGRLEESLTGLSQVFTQRAVATYKLRRKGNMFLLLLSANNLGEFISNIHYLQKVQENDRNVLIQMQTTQTNYEDQKAKVEDLKKSLEAQKNNLAAQKSQKQYLLKVTQNDEKKFQDLLAQANAQLNALLNFAKSHVSGIIPHSDLSDSWGKYYNQRDANWGARLIGNSDLSVADVGCLISSYAMVVSHYGGSINPGDVASNTGNFWASTALFLSPGPDAAGHTATSVDNPSLDFLRNQLGSGHSVIAGLSYDGGSIADHWVVLRSVDGDSFKINDPLYEGAMNVSLNDHYKNLKIVAARIYQ